MGIIPPLYSESETCCSCLKDGKPCVMLQTESYAGWHCQKCLFAEARKRAAAEKQAAPQFDGARV